MKKRTFLRVAAFSGLALLCLTGTASVTYALYSRTPDSGSVLIDGGRPESITYEDAPVFLTTPLTEADGYQEFSASFGVSEKYDYQQPVLLTRVSIVLEASSDLLQKTKNENLFTLTPDPDGVFYGQYWSKAESKIFYASNGTISGDTLTVTHDLPFPKYDPTSSSEQLRFRLETADALKSEDCQISIEFHDTSEVDTSYKFAFVMGFDGNWNDYRRKYRMYPDPKAENNYVWRWDVIEPITGEVQVKPRKKEGDWYPGDNIKLTPDSKSITW